MRVNRSGGESFKSYETYMVETWKVSKYVRDDTRIVHDCYLVRMDSSGNV